MQVKAAILAAMGGLALGVACGAEGGGRGGGEARGVWDGGGKFDDTATCSGACGDMAAAGCWCDETCAAFGDCCPDKVAECGGTGPSAGSGAPGEVLGRFDLRYWFLADETRYDAPHDTTIFDPDCNVLADVPEQFVEAIAKEGRGRLEDERVVEFFGECECAVSPCFFELDDAQPWGAGLGDRTLVPFRSVAVDPTVISVGSLLYIAELDGLEVPGEAPWGGFVHDGCVVADDAANAFDGTTVGLFSALVAHYITLDKALPDEIELRGGGERCGAESGGSDDGGSDDGDPSDPTPQPLPEPSAGDLCFPGPSGANDACVPLVPASESGYSYPAPLGGSANYRAPIAMIDLEAVDDWLPIAPSFVLAEIAQIHKGRYAVVQPHAVAKLQILRDMLGPLKVNSGYRPPSYNQMVGGAEYSRHMYGDAYDLSPTDVSLGELEQACVGIGGKLVEYNTHAHCDFRHNNVDPLLFGAAALDGEAGPVPDDGYDATITFDGERLHVTTTGFDEGAPRIRWSALDADGEILESASGASFVPPPRAASVEAIVGGQVAVSWSR